MSVFLERQYMLDVMYKGLKLYHTSFVSSILNKTNALKLLPERLGNMAMILPPVQKDKRPYQTPFRTKKQQLAFQRLHDGLIFLTYKRSCDKNFRSS